MGTKLTKEEVAHDQMRSNLNDLEVGPDDLKLMSAEDIFDHVLRYEGIIGFTGQILDWIKESNRIAKLNNQPTIEV